MGLVWLETFSDRYTFSFHLTHHSFNRQWKSKIFRANIVFHPQKRISWIPSFLNVSVLFPVPLNFHVFMLWVDQGFLLHSPMWYSFTFILTSLPCQYMLVEMCQLLNPITRSRKLETHVQKMCVLLGVITADCKHKPVSLCEVLT